jgi:hypothetical protein
MGVNVGLSDPAASIGPVPNSRPVTNTRPVPRNRDDDDLLYVIGGGFPDGRCTMDGVDVGCSMATALLRNGAAVLAPQQMTRWNHTTKSFEFFRAMEGAGWSASGKWVQEDRPGEKAQQDGSKKYEGTPGAVDQDLKIIASDGTVIEKTTFEREWFDSFWRVGPPLEEQVYYYSGLHYFSSAPRLPDGVSVGASIEMPARLSGRVKGAGWGGSYTLARDGSVYFSACAGVLPFNEPCFRHRL